MALIKPDWQKRSKYLILKPTTKRAPAAAGPELAECVGVWLRIVAISSGNCGQFYPHLRSCKFSLIATGWELISRETTEWFRAWQPGLGGFRCGQS